MQKILVTAVASLLCGTAAFAQVGTTVKEGAKATGEKAQQVGDEAKASVSSQPTKSVDKAKASTHKAKSHAHAAAAKDAAKEVPK
jgi:Sec-independent protein translocase protein TatA